MPETIKHYAQSLYACPIVALAGYTAAHQLPGPIYAYLDFGGATGSAKDGLAQGMLALAAQKGKLAPGQTVLEAGGSTFAAALTLAARAAGHPVTLAVPESLPAARQATLKRYGAKLVYSGALYGRRGAEKLAAETAEKCGGYYVDYFCNDGNPEYHRRTTGQAIVKAIGGEGPSLVDAVVVGVGSGGTITGVGETIKAWTNDVRMVAVEPYESQAIGGGFVGKHSIPGIGAGFVPENYNPYVVDLVSAVSSGDAAQAAREVLLTDTVPACASAGAVLYAARQLLEKGQSRAALCIFSGRQIYE
ncbi:MAG: pyridoxal-phosphate dependent enzyme [Faecalibacterium sp.]|jgi:cysteine synthase A|nr:pyridoxal-phosphate dependent enzyme [Faecalibacterium sp.]